MPLRYRFLCSQQPEYSVSSEDGMEKKVTYISRMTESKSKLAIEQHRLLQGNGNNSAHWYVTKIAMVKHFCAHGDFPAVIMMGR